MRPSGIIGTGSAERSKIVLGLQCDEQGTPLSIEVFPDNTQDPKTVRPQLRNLAERLGGDELTFVGDRGMLQSRQIQEVQEHGFHISPRSPNLRRSGIIQLELFEDELAEVEDENGIMPPKQKPPD